MSQPSSPTEPKTPQKETFGDVHDDVEPLTLDIKDGPTRFTSPGVTVVDAYRGRTEKTQEQHSQSPCCATHRALRSYAIQHQSDGTTEPLIQIVDAQKTTDLTGSSFVVYLIRTLDPANHRVALVEVKRRYSEFESLRKSLIKLYPTIIVSTLPEKNSFADYASKQSKAKEDPHMIAKRKRMLASFINRIAAHPVLSGEHMFHRFLETGNWNDVLASTPVPKERSKSPLKRLTERKTPKNPDAHWSGAEAYTQHYIESMATTYRAGKMALGEIETACSASADLGSIYNGWSLHESSQDLSKAIERFGQAADNSQKFTGEWYQELEEKFVEPIQEQQQLALMVAKVLKWRSSKQIELEDANKSLESAKSQLASLETSEQEAQRLQAVLNRHLDPSISSVGPTSTTTPTEATESNDKPSTPPPEKSLAPSSNVSPSKQEVSTNPYDPSHPIYQSDVLLPPKSTSSFSAGGILSSINSFLDNDPESTRRNTISRLREKILTLSEKSTRLQSEIELANQAIQRDLDRYQRDKTMDWKVMMLDFAKAMKKWSMQELDNWKTASSQFDA